MTVKEVIHRRWEEQRRNYFKCCPACEEEKRKEGECDFGVRKGPGGRGEEERGG